MMLLKEDFVIIIQVVDEFFVTTVDFSMGRSFYHLQVPNLFTIKQILMHSFKNEMPRIILPLECLEKIILINSMTIAVEISRCIYKLYLKYSRQRNTFKRYF